MNGVTMIIAGGACIGIGIITFIVSIIYQKTVGKKIKTELDNEYS